MNWHNADTLKQGDIMYMMKDFIQAEFLLLLLTVTAAVNAPFPYIYILFSSLLMIFFTIRSLSENDSMAMIFVQIVLSGGLCLFGGGFFSFLIFSEVRAEKIKRLRIVLPPVFFAGTAVLTGSLIPPQILLRFLILLAVSVMLYMLEKPIVDYIEIKSRIAGAVSVTAVNELYEKKLNHELILKNYLADRNARLEERENISRNIHNSVGHSITAAVMALDAAELLFDTRPEKAREKMKAANERMRGSIASIRHAVRVLDVDNPYVSIEDLQSELKAIIDNFMMDTMLKVGMDFPGEYQEMSLPHEHTEFLTGALQELLSNGIRHGKADAFTVRLTADSGHVRLQVADNGKSDFKAENETERIKNGFGLKKLIAYTCKCGGTVKFSHGMGLTVEITLPVQE